MKMKVEWWHVCVALVIAIISAFIGAVAQILLVNYGVFDNIGYSTAGYSEAHDFTFQNDTLCMPNGAASLNEFTEKCVMNGYTTYTQGTCTSFGNQSHDLFLRCVR